MSEEEVKQPKIKKIGDRQSVYTGLAQMTKGGLKREDLIFDEKTNKYKSKKSVERGRILVSNMQKKLDVEEPIQPIDPEPVVKSDEIVKPKPKRTYRKKQAVPVSDEETSIPKEPE